VAPDGETVVFSQRQDSGEVSLWEINIASGQTTLVYDCKDASCNNPVVSPDGTRIAFERAEINRNLGMSYGVPRVWVLERAANTVRPLLADSQQLGYTARWSPDSSKLAFFSMTSQGVVIYDFKTGQSAAVPTLQGEIGEFSPDGRFLMYPKIVEQRQGDSTTAVKHMVLVDVTTPDLKQTDVLPDDDTNDDKEAVWSADGKALIVVRPPPGQVGAVVTGLYRVDWQSRAAEQLLLDNDFSNTSLAVSPDGSHLLFQRYQFNQPGARTQIWVYNFANRELKRLALNATGAQWAP
jgi:Tol biopolymer transport system component